MSPPRLFRFLGHETGVDLARMVDTDPGIARLLREHAAPRFGAARGRRVVEDMLEVALHGAGEHFVGRKGAVIDRIVAARTELIGIFDAVVAKGARADVAGSLKRLEGIYRDLDEGLAALNSLVERDPPPKALEDGIAARIRREVRETEPGGSPHAARPAAADLLREGGHARTRLARYFFRKKAGADTYVRRYRDGATVELTVRNDRMHVETFDGAGRHTGSFGEAETLVTPYGRLPRTSAIMQAHHGLEGSLMTQLFGRLYDHDAVPTIVLRDNKTGSPHGIVTAMGNMFRKGRENPATLTYSALREYAIADLKAAGVPDDAIGTYLAAIDRHVREAIVPQLSAAKRADLLGDWKP